MQNKNKVIILVGLIALVSLAGCSRKSDSEKSGEQPQPAEEQKQEPGPLIGGERDSHGCLISGGYTWCEPKNECLRIWEGTCYSGLEQEIQYALAKKYDRPASEVKVTVSKEDAGYAGGSVLFGQGGPGEGGMFLAWKIGNNWNLVFDGNGNVDCQKMRQEFQFPDSVLKPNFCN